jgi:TolB-like protein/Tfp pilus assembly protein PilF/tRNA A-37 threonylcarbamoyl transferase component Bud32
MNHEDIYPLDAENPEFSDELIGQTFGVYRIKREIGRGGMGVVYLADRIDGAFKQEVAIKFVKRGMDTDSILRRFRNERQILASLSHPNVALLYDGGTTDRGLPYFVMEYVSGEPLYKFCDSRRLSLKERLKIFVKVCDAVHAAHQIKVVHRDLKPSNILVKADGTPKLLDFGIAKLLDTDLADSTIEPTATQMRMMTPEYASPEQVGGGEITPASDIYSLGVLLYELLSGHRPYRLKNRSPYEIARVICEESPESLIESLESRETFVEKSEVQTLEKVLESRGSNLYELRQELSGELEQIVMNALHKRAEDRYRSALELAEDIGLYLKGQPIKKRFAPRPKTQRPITPEKFSLAVLPLKMIGAALSEDTGDQYLSIGLADALVTRLSRVNRLVVRPTSSTLRFIDHPDAFDVGRELGVEFIVDGNIRLVGQRIRVTAQLLNVNENATHWSEIFDEQFTDVLELEDSLSEKIAQSLISRLTGEEERQLHKRGTDSLQAYEAYLKGRFYWNLQTEEGFARAIQYYQQAVTLDPDYALAYAAIAEYYIFIGIHCVIPFAEGSIAAKEAAEKAIRLDPTLAEGYAALGFAAISYEMDWKKAEALFLRAVELNPNSITAHFWYVTVLGQLRHFDEALDQLKKVQELDPGSLLGRHMVAWILYHARRFDESAAAHEKMLREDPAYAWGLQTYSWVLRRLGRFEEAVTNAARAVQLTGDNPFYLTALCAAHAEAGEREKAEEILRQLGKIAETRFVSDYMVSLIFCALENIEEAFAYLEKAVTARDAWTNWLGTEPQFDILRSDPRFTSLLKRTGNPLATPVLTYDQKVKSIAVLPLRIIGETEKDNEYLAIGLADVMTTRLSKVHRLIVRPTNSVLRFAGEEDAFAAGRALNVRYVLSGTLRSSGTRIRISAQLLDIALGTTLWADQFDEEFTDVLDLEDLVAEKVARLLIPKLTGEEKENLAKRSAQNIEAYEAYLRGRYHLYLFTPDNFARALSYFEKAIELDPEYALAYVALSDCYFALTAFASQPPRECFPMIEKMAGRAIEIDETLGDAYAALGMARLYDLDLRRGEQLLKKGLELNPNQQNGYVWYSVFLTMSGRYDESVTTAQKAIEIDPISAFHQNHYTWILYHARRFDEALKQIYKNIQTEPNFSHGEATRGWMLRYLGRIDEAIQHGENALRLAPGTPWAEASLAASYARSGQTEKARAILERLEAEKARYVSPFCLAVARLHLGEREKALELLERSVDDRDVWFGWIPVEPQLDALRDDRRFIALMRRVAGLAAPDTGPAGGGQPKSIAILPLKFFGTTGPSEEEEYLSLGLTDALITRLSNVQRLTVRPTASVMPFQHQTVNPLSAGRDLKVEYIVDGNIRRAGEMIRISLQLLKVDEEKSLWARNFDEKFTDVLALEDSISEQVTRALIPRLTTTEQRKLSRRETNNPEAYQAYLRGRFFWNQFTPETFHKALESFEKAVRLDPEYALAYVGIADYYNWATIFGFYTPREGHEKTRAAVVRALEIDDQLSEAIAVLGFITAFADYDWAEAERLFKQALELNPNFGLAHEWYAALLAGNGRDQEAAAEILRALELDPLSIRAVTLTAWTLYHLRRYREALVKAEEITEMNPTYYQGFFQRGNVLNELGRLDEALEAGLKGMQLAPELGYMNYKVCFTLAALDRDEEAWRILRDFESLPSVAEVNSYHLGMCYAAVGERDQAFKWFNKAVDDRHPWCTWLATEPKLDPLRDDERFNELLRKTNRSHLIRETLSAAGTDEPQTLAVLPLKFNSLNREDEAEEKFLGFGLTDALITRLSKTKQLIVRPTGSILRFENITDAFAAGKELKVKFVLSGTGRRVGERVRVSVQLLDIERQSTPWAEKFDEKFTDILELEDSISEQVSRALIPQLTTTEKRKISRRETNNPQAFEAYLRGRYHWNQFTPDSLPKALKAFETAVTLDPNYALAYVGLADFYDWANIYGLMPAKSAIAQAEKYALQAAELDESLGEAYATLGLIKQHRKQWSEAERLKQKAIELNPNYTHAHEWYSAQLIGLGKTHEGIREISIAEQLDPLSRRTKALAAWTFYQAHRFDEALKRGRQILELDRNYPQGYMQSGVALWGLGLYEEASPHFRKAHELIPNSALPKYLLCFDLVKNGRRDEARLVLEEIKKMARNTYVKPYFLAMASAALGKLDDAFEYFEQSLAEDDPWMLWFATEPMLEEIRTDARYLDILRRMDHPLAEKHAIKKNEKKPAARNRPSKSVAFLPLRFIGEAEEEGRYLAVGLVDAMITRLSALRRLIVRPTSSVLRFQDRAMDAFEAGRELGVEFVVDGTVRRVGERVRVNTQLLSINDRSTVWAEKFDEKFTDVLDLEDLISEKVVLSIVPQLTREEEQQLQKRGTNSPAAYDAYLRGRYFANEFKEDSLLKSIEAYREAVRLDPNYALPHVGIADFYVWSAIFGALPCDAAYPKAKDELDFALGVDDSLAEAYALKAFIALLYDWDWHEAEALAKRALALNPNYYFAHDAYAHILCSRGVFPEAVREIETAEELDPLSPRAKLITSCILYQSRNFQNGAAKAGEAVKMQENSPQAFLHFGNSLTHNDQSAKAVEVLSASARVWETSALPKYMLCFALVADGQRDAARRVLEEVLTLARSGYVKPYFVAMSYAALGENDLAFEWFEKSIIERDDWMIWFGTDIKLDNLRQDPRYRKILKKTNNPIKN